MDRRKVIWNAKGRKTEVLNQYYERTEVLNQYYESICRENCEKIESVALDGAKTYIASTKQYAKNAMIVYDKFHLVQKLKVLS